MEGIMASMQRKHENEVADLHATVDRLLKVRFVTQMCKKEALNVY